MKALSALGALLTVAVALTTRPSGGTQITDPVVLAKLAAQRADALAKYNSGIADATIVDGNMIKVPSLEERQAPEVVAGIAGFLLYEAGVLLGSEFLIHLAKELYELFTGDNGEIWASKDHCRTYFHTHAGGEEIIRTYDRHADARVTDYSNNTGWVDPGNTDPPVFYFSDDAVGDFSVQFTATDEYAWDGIKGTKECPFQGLCNPQYIFYRLGYNIILNTWQSQGVVAECQYSGGKDCKGLCKSGVNDEFSTNGIKWSGDCAIPCKDEANEGLHTEPTGPDGPYKVMIVGDSISQGMEADWTWRYRLYDWFKATYPNFEMVGPYTGTLGPLPVGAAEPQPPLFAGESVTLPERATGFYAEGTTPGISAAGHGAWWGRQAAQVKYMIGDWVAEYQPDYLLVLLGFNDLGWFVSGPDNLKGDMGAIVEAARENKADINILLGNVVDREFLEGRQDLVDNTATYNNLLKDTIPDWFREGSPIAYVDVNSYYDCRPKVCLDGYDGLHPNSMGEYHIAQAFADVLDRYFGFSGNSFKVPDSAPKRVVSTPTGMVCMNLPEGVYTAWDEMETARGYEIRSRIEGQPEWWSSGPVYPNTHASLTSWVVNGYTWEFQTRTQGDGPDLSDWGPSCTVKVDIDTAPGPHPDSIVSVPVGRDSIEIAWEPVTGYNVNRYGVTVWDLDVDDAFTITEAASGTPHTVTGLVAGHTYGTWVATYVEMTAGLTAQSHIAGGLPSAGRSVIVGRGKPEPPKTVVIHNSDPTTVILIWNWVAEATMYAIYYTSLNGDGEYKLDGTTEFGEYTIAFLFPGTWTYRYCVKSLNGFLESLDATCVVPEVYPGYEKRDMMPGNDTALTAGGKVVNTTSQDVQLQRLYSQLMRQEGTLLSSM